MAYQDVEVSGFRGALSYFNTRYSLAEPHDGCPVFSTPVGPDGEHEDLHIFFKDGAWMMNDAGDSWAQEEAQCKAFLEGRVDMSLPEGAMDWQVWGVEGGEWESCPITLTVAPPAGAAMESEGNAGSTGGSQMQPAAVAPAAGVPAMSPAASSAPAHKLAKKSKKKSGGCCGSRVRSPLPMPLLSAHCARTSTLEWLCAACRPRRILWTPRMRARPSR